MNPLGYLLIAAVSFSLPTSLTRAKVHGPFESRGHRFRAHEILKDRGVIWGMEFISKNEMIFTERAGGLYLFDVQSRKLVAIRGLNSHAKIAVHGQGGLLDIKTHPRFSKNRRIFLTYSEETKKGKFTTVLALAGVQDRRLKNFKVLFRAGPASSSHRHFGSRMAIRGDDLFFSIGDRGERASAQKLDDDRGKIHRLKLDGKVPPDNPFFSTPKARKTLYSYGHRNPQGLSFHPVTGKLWSHEHGPRGGDEINIIKRGANYGWPVVSYGKEYWGPIRVGEGTSKPGMVSPLKQYTPSIAPSGMLFYSGKLFPKWRGHLFLGSLAYNHLGHLAISKGRVTFENRLLKSLEMRVRDVEEGPDGFIYVSTDEGSLLRLTPFGPQK
ncbi:MAG: PQQ-dependent sugar dehydrogenase [Bacteriovoracales bacterium]|nr:PQQ-dependent sugar dehydrogenase [Bacteriovoracales bacterium]